MQKILNKIIIIIFFLITACAASWEDVKKGLGGQKRTSTDEFLVKKKNPLTLPPKFDDLPEPGKSTNLGVGEDIKDVMDIEQLLQKSGEQTNPSNLESGDSLEDSVLKKIKQK